MKTLLLSACALLPLAGGVCAQTGPGYDRPASRSVHQHVVYWNDSFDHYDYSMQTAADAYSTDDLHGKHDDKPDKMYPHKLSLHKQPRHGQTNPKQP